MAGGRGDVVRTGPAVDGNLHGVVSSRNTSSSIPSRSLPTTSTVPRETNSNSDCESSFAPGRPARSLPRGVARAPAAVCGVFRLRRSSASRAILPTTLAPPQQIIRRTPQQAAARTIRDRFTLLRIGGQATISSAGPFQRGRRWWRCCTKSSDMETAGGPRLGGRVFRRDSFRSIAYPMEESSQAPRGARPPNGTPRALYG